MAMPLGVSIVVGLLVSQLLTLFTTPVIICGSTALRSVCRTCGKCGQPSRSH